MQFCDNIQVNSTPNGKAPRRSNVRGLWAINRRYPG